MARASAIVRARMVQLTADSLHCDVVRVIYGRVPGSKIRSAGLPLATLARGLFRRQYGREPARDELRTAVIELCEIEAGREAILLLGPGREHNGLVVAPIRQICHDCPSSDPLDEQERRMIEVLEAGSHLSPPGDPEDLSAYVRSSEFVVRAELTAVDPRTTHWEVRRVLHVGRDAGEVAGRVEPSTTIAVGLDPWRLRAESIARYRAMRKQADMLQEEDVLRQFVFLLENELPIGREAILMLRSRMITDKDEVAGTDEGPHKLIAILPGGSPTNEQIDRVERSVHGLFRR